MNFLIINYMVCKNAKRCSKKGGFLGNRSGLNAQTYCCTKPYAEARHGTGCIKSRTGTCMLGSILNAKMRCFNEYPPEGDTIYENENCEFVSGVTSKVGQTVGTVAKDTATYVQTSTMGAYTTGKAVGQAVGSVGYDVFSTVTGSGGKRIKNSKKRKSSKRRRTAKKN
jgi:hypothetical protein